MRLPEPPARTIDYRQVSASDPFVPNPAVLSSSGWSGLHVELHQQPKFEVAEHQYTMHVLACGLPVDAGSTVGFVAAKLDSESGMGEIYMVAVDPDFQGHGIGTALIEFALSWMKEAGMSVAMVETGGDPGHAPARRTYEKLGFGLLPIARYFKKL